jgi:hypothetical protein
MGLAIMLAFSGNLLAVYVYWARTLGPASGRPGAMRNPVTLGEGIPVVMDMGV